MLIALGVSLIWYFPLWSIKVGVGTDERTKLEKDNRKRYTPLLRAFPELNGRSLACSMGVGMDLGIIRFTIAAHKLIGVFGGNQLPLSKWRIVSSQSCHLYLRKCSSRTSIAYGLCSSALSYESVFSDSEVSSGTSDKSGDRQRPKSSKRPPKVGASR
jgi:hypothetical protein